MMQSDITGWSAAILLSLMIHGMLFMQSGARMGVENASILRAPVVTRLNFDRLVEQPVLDEPRPVEKKPVQPKKKPKPEAIKQKPVIRQPLPQEEPEPVRRQVSNTPVQGIQVPRSSDGLLQRKRQQYFHTLLSHIESFKYYPRSARRRSIEGEVDVSFILGDDGFYRQLKLDGRHAVLVKATQQALEAATPLPLPPEDTGLSRQIAFSMAYSLAR